jgi:hypothetical protein
MAIALRSEAHRPGLATTARVQRLEAALAEAETLDQVVEVDRVADALQQVLRVERASLAEVNRATELRLRVQRRAGSLLLALARAPRRSRSRQVRGRSEYVPKLPQGTLRRYGIDPHQSSTWQRLAALPEDLVEQRLAELNAGGQEVTLVEFVRLARPYARAQAKRQATGTAQLLRAALQRLQRVTSLRTPEEYALAEQVARLGQRWHAQLHAADHPAYPLRGVQRIVLCALCGAEAPPRPPRCPHCGGSWVTT